MPSDKLLKNLSTEEKDLNSRIFDLVIGRVFKKVYLGLSPENREIMEKVFVLNDNKEKERIIKKFMPNFKTLFEEETKQIENEIKAEIEKQI